MKTSLADGFSASTFFLLGVFAHIASGVALTIPTASSLEPAIPSHDLPILLPSLNATSLNASHYDPLCAPSNDDQKWFNVPVGDKWRYDYTCYEAIRLFSKEQKKYDAEKFEFLAPGARPATQLRPMQTPRRYSFGGSASTQSPSCTVVVAMLNFASPGQLPGQPPGPFQPKDVASFEDLEDSGGDVFNTCIRAPGVGILPNLHFGWVRAGQGGNIGVFFTGTKSQIDRSIPRGIHP